MTSKPLKVLLVAPDKSLLGSLSKLFDLLGLVALQVTDPRGRRGSHERTTRYSDSGCRAVGSGRTRTVPGRMRRRAAQPRLYVALGTGRGAARRYDRGPQVGRRRFPGEAARVWRTAFTAAGRGTRIGIRAARAGLFRHRYAVGSAKRKSPFGTLCQQRWPSPSAAARSLASLLTWIFSIA